MQLKNKCKTLNNNFNYLIIKIKDFFPFLNIEICLI